MHQSSSGPGHRPFKAKITGSNPVWCANKNFLQNPRVGMLGTALSMWSSLAASSGNLHAAQALCLCDVPSSPACSIGANFEMPSAGRYHWVASSMGDCSGL